MIDLSFLSCWLFLVLSSGIFYKSYSILDSVLQKKYLKYNNYDNDRKEYILTNMLKSIFLFFMSIAVVANIGSGTINLYDTSNWSANIIFWKNLVDIATTSYFCLFSSAMNYKIFSFKTTFAIIYTDYFTNIFSENIMTRVTSW